MSEACKTCGGYRHPLNAALRKKDEELAAAAIKLSAARATNTFAAKLVEYQAARITELVQQCETKGKKISELEQTIATIQAETINNSYLHQGNGTK